VTVSPRRFVVVKFSPALVPQVRSMIRDLDDGTTSIAEIWRDVGYRARRRKLLQPSYESVRRLVRAQRRRPARPYSRLKRAAILAWELAFGARDPRLILFDMITGDDIDRRPHLYRRRARDGSSRTTTREVA
jgi:hypothetical protein